MLLAAVVSEVPAVLTILRAVLVTGLEGVEGRHVDPTQGAVVAEPPPCDETDDDPPPPAPEPPGCPEPEPPTLPWWPTKPPVVPPAPARPPTRPTPLSPPEPAATRPAVGVPSALCRARVAGEPPWGATPGSETAAVDGAEPTCGQPWKATKALARRKIRAAPASNDPEVPKPARYARGARTNLPCLPYRPMGAMPKRRIRQQMVKQNSGLLKTRARNLPLPAGFPAPRLLPRASCPSATIHPAYGT